MIVLLSSSCSSPFATWQGTSAKRKVFIRPAYASLLSLTVAINVGTPATNDLADGHIEGLRLAQEIREMRPAENFVQEGVLKIFKNPGKPLQIPVRCQSIVTESNWSVTYSIAGTNNNHAASFRVIHAQQQPNEYRLFAGADDPTNEFKVLTGGDAWIPFAGSDFWLADLGLEFLHWPTQRILKKEMRRSCFCLVLESVNPRPAVSAYSRVVSWIDKDSSGIVHADAYDLGGKLLKEFNPKDLTKMKGQWRVGELHIRNVRTGSRTRLEFDLEKK